jgi:hypothetical protein
VVEFQHQVTSTSDPSGALKRKKVPPLFVVEEKFVFGGKMCERVVRGDLPSVRRQEVNGRCRMPSRE